jgi:hypothetical protein
MQVATSDRSGPHPKLDLDFVLLQNYPIFGVGIQPTKLFPLFFG